MLAQAPLAEGLTQSIAVVGAVGEQDVAWPQAAQHVGGGAAVMGLALGKLEDNRQAIGVHNGVDLGGQASARRPCTGLERGPERRPTWRTAPPFCRCPRAGGPRMDELSTI